MVTKPTVAVLLDGTLRMEGDRPALGMFAAIHDYAGAFDLVVVTGETHWNDVVAWLNSWEFIWRTRAQQDGLPVPAKMVSVLVRFSRTVPAGCTLIARDALPHIEGFHTASAVRAFISTPNEELMAPYTHVE